MDKKYEEKTYSYEKFTTCTELLSELKNAKKSKYNFGNIFKIIFENRWIAVQVQNLATESFKFILHPFPKMSFKSCKNHQENINIKYQFQK